jgi:cytochrome c oxidase subunit 1
MSTAASAIDAPAVKRLTVVWALTVIAVFLVLVLLGFVMRMAQAGDLPELGPDRFYALMTLHGLGMAGTLFVGGLAAVWYLACRYARPSRPVLWTVYVLTLAGTVGLIAATLLGRFGAGWYILYPLPFITVWPGWATGLAIISLLVLGVGWLLGQLELLRALVMQYGLGNVLGWQYLTSHEPRTEIPPFVLIVTVSLIAGALTTVFGAALLMLYLFKWFTPTLQFDALLMKNLVFLFGHTLVNITMYFGLAIVYERLPDYSGRPWKTNRLVAIAWNATLLLVLVAFLHHLYMDFAQPLGLQVAGQVASYLSAVPATAVTVFGAISQVYRAGIRWKFAPLSYYLGLIGWVIGGLAAIVDSTIIVNFFFHNTLWVPAHFHTYFLLGFVFILFGFIAELFGSAAERAAKLSLWVLAIGGYGFVLMFYLAGLFGVPRRFAAYTILVGPVSQWGQALAGLSVYFVALVVVGLLIYAASVLRGLNKAWSGN